MPRKKQPKSHRHFVAVPLAALIVSISVLDGALPVAAQPELSASVTRPSEGEALSLPRGMQAILYSGRGFSIVDRSVAFEDGSALVNSDGLMTLTVAGNRISAFSGAFYLSYFGDDISIAAVNTPVLVRDGSRLMVVPAGMQWRTGDADKLPLLQAGYPLWLQARQVQEFPNRFLIRQLQNLAFLPEKEDVLPPVRSFGPLPLWTKLPTLKVGTARESAEQAWQEEVLGTLRGLIESGDGDATDAFLRDERYREVFASEEAYALFVALLLRQSEESLMRSLLLSYLIVDENFWLLASLHPDLREETWALFSQHENPEARTLRLFLLPTSNVTAHAVSSSVMQRWVYELSKLERGEKAQQLVQAIVEQHLPLVSTFEERGYPERSRTLATALLTLVEKTQISLASDLSSELSELTSFERMSLETPPPVELPDPEEEQVEEVVVEEPVVIVDIEVEQPEEEPVFSYSPAVVERRTYTLMRDIGALFTVETEIDAVAPNTARVRNIVFPADKGDYTLDFHFDVAKGEVNQIVMGSREHPYPLSLEAFRDWIR